MAESSQVESSQMYQDYLACQVIPPTVAECGLFLSIIPKMSLGTTRARSSFFRDRLCGTSCFFSFSLFSFVDLGESAPPVLTMPTPVQPPRLPRRCFYRSGKRAISLGGSEMYRRDVSNHCWRSCTTRLFYEQYRYDNTIGSSGSSTRVEPYCLALRVSKEHNAFLQLKAKHTYLFPLVLSLYFSPPYTSANSTASQLQLSLWLGMVASNSALRKRIET